MTFSRAERRGPDKGSSQPLFLSLFLLLLAFFIMLNALSTVEQGRSDRVMESVKRAFPSAVRKNIADDPLDRGFVDIELGEKVVRHGRLRNVMRGGGEGRASPCCFAYS